MSLRIHIEMASGAAWRHIEYPKIEQPRRVGDWLLGGGVRWVVTEKVHGANFSFVTNGSEVRCAKRRSFLAEDEQFYCWKKVRDRHAAAVLRLFAEVARLHEARFVHLYGEIYGGSYPHPDVRPTGDKLVQHGVYYCPEVRFVAFDLLVVPDDAPPRFLPHEEAAQLLDRCGIPRAEPLLVTNSLAEALAYPLGFVTRIPASLGLPPLEANVAEGVVVKADGGMAGGGDRPMFKVKHPRFQESCKSAGRAAERGAAKKGQLLACGDLGAYVVECAGEEITRERLASALSKVGEVRLGDDRVEELVAEFSRDVADELAASCAEQLAALSPSLLAAVHKKVANKCRGAVMRHLHSVARREKNETVNS